MKILVLILTSDSDVYCVFQQLWARYMNLNPNIHCYFYKADPTLDVPIRKIGNNIIVQMEESFDNVYSKTLEVFKYLHDKFDDYDFILRTNLSSFFRFDKYLEACKTFPKKNFCSAVVGTHENQQFPSGAGFTITPDLAKLIATSPPTPVCLDDVSIGKTLLTNGVRFTNAERYNVELECDINAIETSAYHFRLCTSNRMFDIAAYAKLIEKYYPESL
jgi:hypothetical protein